MGLVFVILLIVIVVAIVFGSMAEKKRREELAALAVKLGLRFIAETDYAHEERYKQFSQFTRGSNRYAHNRLVGTMSIGGYKCQVLLGDYHYQVRGNKNQTYTHRFSFALVHMPWPGVPGMVVRPEGMMDKVAEVFGFDDIDFESAEFSQKFMVKSADRKFAYAVITPQMMEYLLQTQWPGLEISGGVGLVVSSAGRWSPDVFERMLLGVGEFLSRWPRHVVAELESGVR